MPDPKPLVIQTIDQWRDRIKAHEAVEMRTMARRWMQVEDNLRADYVDLADYLAELRDKGEVISAARLMQMDRYRKMIADARVQNNEFSAWADTRIKSNQDMMLENGIVMGQETIRAAMFDAHLVGVSFDHINASAVNFLIGFASDGSPLSNLLKASYPEHVLSLTDALVKGLATGKGPRETARIMADGMSGNLDRALTIARTEQLRALRTANLAQMDQSSVVDGYIRRAQRAGNVCPACIALDGEEQDTAEVFESHPNCLVPGAFISGAIPEYASRRDYHGDVITISTAAGNLLTVTPNHPVLTDRGWVAAQFLVKGDNVISGSFGERVGTSIDPDYNHVPTLIENIAQTFNLVRLGLMPVSPEDFHGDGKHSDVGVIFANRLLLDNRHVSDFDPLRHLVFGIRNVSGSILASLRSFAEVIVGSLHAANSIMSGGRLSDFLLCGHPRSSQLLGFGQSPDMLTFGNKSSTDNRPGNVFYFRDGLFGNASPVQFDNFLRVGQSDSDGWANATKQPASFDFIREVFLANAPKTGGGVFDSFPAQIKLDRIINIGVSTFDGHVYNLQNKDGWYIANNIITHNCACFAQPKLKYGTTPSFPTGPEWFDTLDESQQRSMLGPGRYDLYASGSLDWGKVATVHNDPVWGPTVQQTNIADLTQ